MATSHTERLLQVTGDNGKKNDVIFSGELKPAEVNVVFFCGDFQDYKENMLAHANNKSFAAWDIESTAAVIARRFASSHVWAVKAAQMYLGTLNIYSNFVKWKDMGTEAISPVYEVGLRSWQHLRKLLENVVDQLNDKSANKVFRADLPVILVGFGRGCSVLNQLAFELAGSSDGQKAEIEQLAKLVKSFYWLDAGHGGSSDAWVTRDDVLASIARFEIHSHVTPYQISDSSRPWIGEEHQKFVSGLQRHNAKVKDVLHFGDKERSLENHFKLLNDF